MEEIVSDIAGYDTLIMLRDTNTKIGIENLWINLAGRESLCNEFSDNDIRLLSFANTSNMYVVSTKFPRKNYYNGSWQSPDGCTINQIDHVMIDKRHLRSVT